MMKLKRIYEPPDGSDGVRILVDRLWPRGVSKDRAKVNLWLREIAPSDTLRKWFGHDPRKWIEFRRRYCRELKSKTESLQMLKDIEKEHGLMTLLFAASDQTQNNAVVLAEISNDRL